jgi:hypothetical protein
MTTELPDHLGARVDHAFAQYLATYNADYSLDNLDDFDKLYSRRETAERELIQSLATIWQEWTHRSPRSCVLDKEPPYGWAYPFAKWVVDLFPEYTDTLRPTPSNRIRRILKRSTVAPVCIK